MSVALDNRRTRITQAVHLRSVDANEDEDGEIHPKLCLDALAVLPTTLGNDTKLLLASRFA